MLNKILYGEIYTFSKNIVSFLRAACLRASILLVSGCSTTGTPLFHFNTDLVLNDDPVGIVWPALPEVPRYRYIGQLTGENNFITEYENKSTFNNVLRWLVGLDSQPESPNVLQRPQGIMVDDRNRIFVTDISRQAVFVFDTQNNELRVWQQAKPGTNFIAPIGIVQGNNNEILIADAELGRVFRQTDTGQYLGEFGQDILQRPTGIARDPVGRLIYVADTADHDIKIFDEQGLLIDTIGRRGTNPGEFNAPTYLAFVHDKLYVSDTLNSRIQVFDASGMLLTHFGKLGLYVGNFNRPKGITADDEGNIYIVESYRDHLLIYNSQGQFLLPIGGTGKNVGEFFLPAGISIDQHNRIYVADMFNGRIAVFQYLGARE